MPYFLSALADINLFANLECFLASTDFPLENPVSFNDREYIKSYEYCKGHSCICVIHHRTAIPSPCFIIRHRHQCEDIIDKSILILQLKEKTNAFDSTNLFLHWMSFDSYVLELLLGFFQA